MKKIVLGILLATSVSTAMADQGDLTGGVNLMNLSGAGSLGLTGIAGSIGYEFGTYNNITVIPEVKIGFGLGDDSLGGGNIELDSLLAFSVRGVYDINDDFYVFAAPSFTNIEVSVSTVVGSVSQDSWELGVGGGAGYRFSDTMSAEASIELIDDFDVLSIGIKMSF